MQNLPEILALIVIGLAFAWAAVCGRSAVAEQRDGYRAERDRFRDALVKLGRHAIALQPAHRMVVLDALEPNVMHFHVEVVRPEPRRLEIPRNRVVDLLERWDRYCAEPTTMHRFSAWSAIAEAFPEVREGEWHMDVTRALHPVVVEGSADEA